MNNFIQLNQYLKRNSDVFFYIYIYIKQAHLLNIELFHVMLPVACNQICTVHNQVIFNSNKLTVPPFKMAVTNMSSFTSYHKVWHHKFKIHQCPIKGVFAFFFLTWIITDFKYYKFYINAHFLFFIYFISLDLLLRKMW